MDRTESRLQWPRRLVGVAAAGALMLWSLLGQTHWIWVLPFAAVIGGVAFRPGQRRWLVAGGGIVAAALVGWIATGEASAAVVGGSVVAAFALLGLAQVWLWEVTHRRFRLATELTRAVGILRAAGVDAEVEGTPESVPVALQPLFGSLVREGASNLLRHTRAGRCEIAVERDGDDVVVRVIDDGVARVVVPSGDGTGVAGLRARFAAVGGRVDATPLAPRGFELCGRAPRPST
jgi:two-component system sensor histidine kinase DesK